MVHDRLARCELRELLYKKRRGCQACHEKDFYKLAVHHVSYKRFGKEKLKDVRLLCHNCHNMLHKYVKTSQPDLDLRTDLFIKGGRFWK